MALPVFTPGKVATTTKSTIKSGLPVFVRPETKLVEVKPTVINPNSVQGAMAKFKDQEISTTLKPGEMRLSDAMTKFKDQEISKPRVIEGPKLPNKISENEFVMKEFQSGRANYKVNPETGKREFTSPEIEVFRNSPDSARAVMLQAQAKESPFIKALESPLGKEVTGQVVDKTSDMPLKLWAGVKTLGSLGQKSYEDAKSELIKAKEDPTNNVFQKFLYQAQDSIPQTLIGVGLALTPGGAYTSSAFFGALSVEGERQKPGGLGDSTVGNVVIDVLGDRVLGGMLDKMLSMPTKLLTGKIVSTLKTAGAEGGTEVTQTFLKYANDYKEANTPEEKQAIIEQAKNYVKSGDMAMEFTVGAVAGAGVGTVGGMMQTQIDIQNKTAEQTVAKHITEAQDVISETPEFITENKNAFLEQIRTNIVDGLKYEGLTKQAEAVAQISVIEIPDIKILQQEVNNVIEGVTTQTLDMQQQMKREPVIEEVPPEVIGEKPASVTRAENSKLPKFEPTTQTQTQTVEEPIFTEARKYNTPEEFVKDNDLVFQGGEVGTQSEWWTTDIEKAREFSTRYGEGIQKGGEIRVARFSDIPGEFRTIVDDSTNTPRNKQDYIKLQTKGQNKIITVPKGRVPILTTVSPESQLTDIWNKAQQTTAPLAKGPQSMPTGAPETQPADKGLQSRVYDRIKSENPEIFKDDATYEAVKLKEDLARAADLVATDKQKAYNIAMGSETSNEVLSNSVSEILFEKALDKGNLTMANTLLKNLSFRATRMGQEIVSLKGMVSNNSTAQFVKELIDTRLAALGKKYLSDVTDTVKNKMKGGKESNQKRGLNKIKEETTKMKEKIGNKKELDLAEAQSIIDKLTCK